MAFHETKIGTRLFLAVFGVIWIGDAVGRAVEKTAAEIGVLRYVLIVANNRGADGLDSLQYADDDGVLYRRLFLPFARRVDLLTVLDDDSQRQHEDVVPATRPPTRAIFDESLAALFQEIETAKRAPAVRTELFLVYVGHGGLDDEGKGFVYLADGKLTRADLFHQVVAASPADFTHVILDSCNAYSMIAGRGGTTNKHGHSSSTRFRNFMDGHDLENYPKVGVLAATSENRETHEWSRIRAGVFSHLVRSALRGAADVNQDGLVEYSEVAAFVNAASADLSRVGKQVSIFVWPPKQDRRVPLSDIRSAPSVRHLVVGPRLSGRYQLEDESGCRIAEFNKPAGENLVLALPSDSGFFFKDDRAEQAIEKGVGEVVISEPPDGPLTIRERGAVDGAFDKGLFSIGFSREYYLGFLSGRSELHPVTFARKTFLDLREEAQPYRRFELDLAYTLSPALLLSAGVENGGAVRIGYQATQTIEWVAGLEIGFADGFPGSGIGVFRLLLVPGVVFHFRPQEKLDLFGALELGYAVVGVTGRGGTVDYSVAVGRVRPGVRWQFTDGYWLSVSAGLAAHLITEDKAETIEARPEFQVSLGW